MRARRLVLVASFPHERDVVRHLRPHRRRARAHRVGRRRDGRQRLVVDRDQLGGIDRLLDRLRPRRTPPGRPRGGRDRGPAPAGVSRMPPIRRAACGSCRSASRRAGRPPGRRPSARRARRSPCGPRRSRSSGWPRARAESARPPRRPAGAGSRRPSSARTPGASVDLRCDAPTARPRISRRSPDWP